MTLEEILSAIEWMETADIVPIMEVITAKLATDFWYTDSYAQVEEAEAPVEEMPVEELPVEEMPIEEMPVEEMPVEEDTRLSL